MYSQYPSDSLFSINENCYYDYCVLAQNKMLNSDVSVFHWFLRKLSKLIFPLIFIFFFTKFPCRIHTYHEITVKEARPQVPRTHEVMYHKNVIKKPWKYHQGSMFYEGFESCTKKSITSSGSLRFIRQWWIYIQTLDFTLYYKRNLPTSVYDGFDRC